MKAFGEYLEGIMVYISILLVIGFIGHVTSLPAGCNLQPIAGKPRSFLLCNAYGCSTWSCIRGELFSFHQCGCVLESLMRQPIPSEAQPKTPVSTTYTMRSPPKASSPSSTTTETYKTSTTKPECFKYSHPTLPSKYIQETLTGNITRDCARGTQFVASICGCDFHLSTPKESAVCLPEVSISASDVNQGSAGWVWIDVKQNVTIVDEMIRFDGRGASIEIPLFDDMDYIDGLTITFSAKELRDTPSRQVLISNCVYAIGPSIEISMDTISKLITFSVAIFDSTEITSLTVPYQQPRTMKDIAMVYNGDVLAGFVGERFNATKLPGEIQPRSTGITIGNRPCDQTMGFQGFVLDVKIYRCIEEKVVKKLSIVAP